MFDVLKMNTNTQNIMLIYFVSHETFIYDDYNMLNSIIRNLISNAIKYSKRGVIINIYTTLNETDVTITVADNALGIK